MRNRDLVVIRRQLYDWYAKNHRQLPWRQAANPYFIWVSEVMLQQTQVNTVVPYYHKFIAKFPDLEHLARADLDEVLKVWEGLGYYARARNLHRAARAVVDHHDGKIPDNWQDFRHLPGVGDYIAAAVLSIAAGQPYPVVDGNVKRVLARLFQIDAAVNTSSAYQIFQETAGRLLDTRAPGTFNQALMELGALVCKPQNPACEICPLQRACQAYQNHCVDRYPRRMKTRVIPELHIAVGVVFKKNQVLITQRKPEGLLGGLWEFPGGKIRPGESAEAACIREIKEEVNLAIQPVTYLTRVKHAYT
ncbi:MAG: A/G-specific adenine glycosylase, partial [Desulfobacterales bacterium]